MLLEHQTLLEGRGEIWNWNLLLNLSNTLHWCACFLHKQKVIFHA